MSIPAQAETLDAVHPGELPELVHASQALKTLEGWFRSTPCRWYEPWTWGQLCGAGTWAPTLGWGWWNSANALTNTIDYTRLSGDSTWVPLIRDAYLLRHDSDYIARDYDDDEGWWALAWIDAFDLFRSQDRGAARPDPIQYLQRAEFIFNDMAAHWDPTCKGGIWWQKSKHYYKASIANELFFAIAIKLYRRTLDERYLGWADATSRWLFEQSGLRGSDGLIMDGMNAAECPGASWNRQAMTYNQGVVLSGLVELDGGLPLAKSIADSVLASSKLTRDGILIEAGEQPGGGGCTGGDCPQFKGIFMRGLGALERALPADDPSKKIYADFIRRNAEAIWSNDRNDDWGTPRFGTYWNGPVAGSALTAGTQTSAVGALVAAMGAALERL
jgi:predicted alpha-1,6-mannanase (GH76 family)